MRGRGRGVLRHGARRPASGSGARSLRRSGRGPRPRQPLPGAARPGRSCAAGLPRRCALLRSVSQENVL